ncbi:carbohydrate family 9 binding domain-like [Terrimicrobium sacchariphilum]|uniref:Carbohydrate family 9 binding domain-like n=1 Tax=Terrimicrobium sacchariphilum TaxID=690879 RepID=A0A146G3B2_TERSA|nr:carbohydrate-binding family 9-like protein [Terrimicrobium sacchariphilum]GAT32319.1 carbohydrate family 9 binding domain-like [Terrimicrobium sacchariphilum]
MPKSVFHFRQTRSLALAGLLLATGPVRAEEPPRATAEYVAIDPKVDGVLEDAVWGKASVINAPAGETRFLWNEKGVYVAFRGVEKTPVMGHAKEGESLHEEDAFELFLDQRGDHRQFYEVQIDPAGRVFVKTHILTAEPRLTEEGRLTPEFGASELWRYVIPPPEGFLSASRLNRETGEWTVEMFLPASFVNRRDDGAPLTPRTLRIHLVRNNWDLAKGEEGRQLVSISWAPVLEKHAHISPTRMGYLELKKPSEAK